MPKYKDPQNNVHHLDDAAFAHLLPDGCVPISEEEAEALRPVAVPAIPQVVSRFQARAALHLAGLLDDVEAMMALPETPVLAKLAWTDAQEFERGSPTIAALAGLVGLTERQIDQLFITAAGIKA